MGIGGAETARLIASLELQDKNFTRGLKNVERGISKVDRRLGAVSGAVNRNLARGIDTVISKGSEFLVGTVKDAADFETAITGVAKTVTGDISGVTDELKKMSTEIPTSFVELAGIAELGGAMGVAKDDLVDFTKQVAILGATTDVSTEDAATALGQLQNVIGLTGDEFDNFAASLVDLGNKGASTESQILEIAKRSGGAATLVGVAKEETLGWASAAANLGLNSELAGTALQNFFIKGAQAQAGLAKVAGVNVKKFKKLFAKDATGALQLFLKGLGKLDKEKRIAAIQEIFGKGSGLTRLILGLAGDTDMLTESLEDGTEAWEKGTAAQEEADKRFKTSESLFKRLDNSVKIVSATIGEALLPVLNDLATEAIDFLNKPGTQKGIKNFATSIGKGVRSLAKIVTAINWGAVAGFLKTAAGFAGQLVTWFGKMPDWAQAFLIGGFVATKLPVIGGLVTELGKGLIKGVLGMTAGVVHIKAGTVVGGGGVPGVGGGAGGKGMLGLGLKGAGGLLVGLTGVGLAAMLAEEFSDEISGLGSQLGFAWRDVVKDVLGVKIPTFRIDQLEWPFGPKNTPTILPEIFGGNGLLGGTGAPLPGNKGGGDRPSPGNPGALRRDIDKIGFDKWLTEAQNIKNAVTTTGAEQKAELGNIKNATATLDTNTKTGLTTVSTGITTAAAAAATYSSGNILATSGTTNAVNTNAAATRLVAPPIISQLSATGGAIVSAIWAARPIVQSTTVVNSYSTSQRGGATSDSRNRGGLGPVG